MEKTIQKIPFLRIAIALAVGVAMAHFQLAGARLALPAAILCTILLIWVHRHYSYGKAWLYGLLVNTILVLLGLYSYHHYNRKPIFYTHGDFLGVVLEVPQEKANSYKSTLQIIAFNTDEFVAKSHEKMMVYFAKTPRARQLQAGDIIRFNAIPQKTENSGNPYEFDYKSYMALKKIYRQVYLAENRWQKTGSTAQWLQIRAERYREKLLTIYRNQPINDTELEILSALTLGYKRDLDPETRQVFSSAGAMHILAVSGLHVGIVWGLVSLLFGFLKKIRGGRALFVAITLLVLWGFAFVTGLSPSVMRASAMFSIVIIGDNLNRKANVYNSLAASAFFLLLINPNNLFNLGFQLSYCAVFGIVFLQPHLEKLVKINNKILRYFWILLTVSVAAQIATAPLSVYYFGQLPVYFWISNMVAIPAVMVLIPAGIGLLLLAKIPVLSTLLSLALNLLLRFLYAFLGFVEQLPGSVLTVHIKQPDLLLLIIVMVSVFLYINNHRFVYAKAALVAFLLLLVLALPRKINRLKKSEIIVYNHKQHAVVHLFSGKTNYVVSTQNVQDDTYLMRSVYAACENHKAYKPVFLALRDTVVPHLLIKSGYMLFNGKTIYFPQGRQKIPATPPIDYLIEPLSLDQVHTQSASWAIKVSQPRQLKNSTFKNLKIHHTGKNGAFVEKW